MSYSTQALLAIFVGGFAIGLAASLISWWLLLLAIPKYFLDIALLDYAQTKDRKRDEE